VLDEVVGVREVARPSGQPSAGPPLERSEVAREEAIECVLISSACPVDQMERRFGVASPGLRGSRAAGERRVFAHWDSGPRLSAIARALCQRKVLSGFHVPGV
jgi:hypothetical protein